MCMVFVLSRGMWAFSIASFPMAKNTVLAATFSDGAQKNAVRVVYVVFALVSAVMMVLYQPVIGGFAVLGAALEYLYYYRMSMKQFGGITGDLAGFHMQICELAIALFTVIGEVVVRCL